VLTTLPRGTGGGGSSHTPHEATDTLRAESYATLVDLLSEGEIVGLCDRNWNPITDPKQYGKGIFLNKTPLMNDDGHVNFDNVYVAQVFGTQSQSYLPGADIASDTVPDGRELRHDFPLEIVIPEGENSTDRVIIAFSFPAYYQQTTQGDISPITGSKAVSIQVQVQLNEGSPYTDQTLHLSGKASSEYVKEILIKLPRSNNPAKDHWTITLTRLTADSTKLTLKNQSFISYISKVVDAKFRYPNSAAIMIHANAKQFTTLPVRGFRVKLRKVSVPSNYFPESRKYTRSAHGEGIFNVGDDTGTEQDWDGTFYTAWTNNPAWVFYDMLSNTRYGLGGYIPVENIDKWTLYSIAQYCDELIDDGRGFLEPRFTCNVYFQTKAEAYKVMNDLASVFRAMIYYAAGTIYCSQDSRKNPRRYQFTNDNVKDGIFNYTGTDIRTRYTVALVTWNDPDDFFSQKYEEVQDTDGIIRYGINVVNVAAFGCTSRGQAHRLGKWMLVTSLRETGVINWGAVVDAMYLRPGDIVPIYDQFKAGVRRGGRVMGISGDRMSVVVDSPVAITGDHLTSADGAVTVTHDSDLVVANNLSTDWTSVGAGSVFYVGSSRLYRIADVFKNTSGFWTLRLEDKWEDTTNANPAFDIAPMSAVFVTPTSYILPGEDIGTSVNIPQIRPTQLVQIALANTTADGASLKLQLASALPASVPIGSIWSIEDKIVRPQLTRLTDISEQNSYEYSITATFYDEQKFDEVEKNLRFVAQPISIVPNMGVVLAPNNPKVTKTLLIRPEGYIGGLHITWQAPPDPTIVGYGIIFRRNGGSWQYITDVNGTSYDFDYGNIYGDYEFEIYAFNQIGTHSTFAYCSIAKVNSVRGVTQDGISFRISGLEITGQGNVTVFEGKDVKFDWRLNALLTAQDIGSETYGAGSGWTDPSFDHFEISVIDLDTMQVVWHKDIGRTLSYTFTNTDNIEAFGVPKNHFRFQVTGFDVYNNFTSSYLDVSNPAPSAPTDLTLDSAFQHIFADWINPSDRDILFTRVLVAAVASGAAVPDISTAVEWVKVPWPQSSTDLSGLISAHDYYVWLTAVDTFGNESDALGPVSTSPGMLHQTDIDDFFVDATLIYSETVALKGDLWFANTPSAGYITVNAHLIYYRGISYPISGLATNDKYIWWNGPVLDSNGDTVTPADTFYSHGNTKPALAPNVYMIAANISGVAVPVWSSIANAVIGSANIVDAAIVNAKIANLAVDAAKIADATITAAKIHDLNADAITAGKVAAAFVRIGAATTFDLGYDPNVAYQELANIASDNVLTQSEKPIVIRDYTQITNEKTGIDAEATTYSITTEKTAYDSAVTALTTYLGGLVNPTHWDDLSGDTTIVGATFRQKFLDVYSSRQTLLNKIYDKAKALADTAQSTADAAAQDITDISSDSLITPDEKPRVIRDYTQITNEQSGIDAQAIAYGITTEKTAYDSAITALTTYLAGLVNPTHWDNLAGNTTIVGATFRQKFLDVYGARQTLLNKILATAQTLATNAQNTADDPFAIINDPSTTTIDGGKITTDTVDANKLKAASILTKVIKIGGGSSGSIESSGFVSGPIGSGKGFRIGGDGLAELQQAIIRDQIQIRTLGLVTFTNDYDGSALGDRSYSPNDTLSVRAHAPTGTKIRYETGGKDVTINSPFWPGYPPHNTIDGVGPDDFVGFDLHSFNQSIIFRARVASGTGYQILSDTVTLIITAIPLDTVGVGSSPAPVFNRTSGTWGSGSVSGNLQGISGSIIKYSTDGVTFVTYTGSTLTIAPTDALYAYQIVSGLRASDTNAWYNTPSYPNNTWPQ
jgi:predicted phage tail protein